MGTNRERVMEKLVMGRDMAAQLQILLREPTVPDGPDLADELAVKILRSFMEALSVLSSGEMGQIPARSVDSGEIRRRPAVKDRRGCYQRRTSDSRVNVSASMEDGYAWRKYGQKAILNSKFPRGYYRCTHKHDQGCKATKQVQIIQEDPHMYQTTYFGRHTCKDHTLMPSQAILDSHILNFESKITNPSLKQEPSKEDLQSDDLSPNNSSLDSVVWSDLMPLDVVSSGCSSEWTSSCGLDMDFFVESFDLESCFCFDMLEFL